MKTTILPNFRHTLALTGVLALLAPAANAVVAPVITAPASGTTIHHPVLDVQVSVAGIQDVQSVKIRANGADIGNATPTSLFGEWSFPDGSHLSVMEGHTGGQVMLDYSPPNAAPMYLMEGSFIDPDTFTGGFTHWDGIHVDPFSGDATVDFSFASTGQLKAAIKGDSPLGTRTLNGGLSMNETYHFVWNNPPEGKQILTAVVSYLPSGSTTPATLTSAAVTVTVDLPKAPEIVVQQPKGSGLTDGAAKRSFGTVKVGGTSSARTFTIKNTGNAKLRGLAITKNGANAKDFIVTGPEKTALAAGASTTFKVVFKPKARGSRSAAIHIKSNDADENPFDIKLIGQGAKP